MVRAKTRSVGHQRFLNREGSSWERSRGIGGWPMESRTSGS